MIDETIEQLTEVQSEPALTVLSKSNTSSASTPTTGSRAADNPSSSSAPVPVVATLEADQDEVPTAQGQGLASNPLGFGLARVVLCVLI